MSTDSKEQSIIHKLYALQDKTKQDMRELRVDFFLERLVVRLAEDPTTQAHLIFKGGFVSRRIYGSERFTSDLDLASRDVSLKDMEQRISIASKREINDGAFYIYKDCSPLTIQGGEGGSRIRFYAGIGSTPKDPKKLMAINVDLVAKAPQFFRTITTSTMLRQGEFVFNVCAPEVTVAEKMHAFIRHGASNTRARDVYDIWKLLPQCESKVLWCSLRATFDGAGLTLPGDIVSDLRLLDTSKLRSVWGDSLVGASGKHDFGTTWDAMLQGLDQKLYGELETARKLLFEEEKRLLASRRSLGYVGTDLDAQFGLGGFPKPLTPEEAMLQSQKRTTSEQSSLGIEAYAKKLLADDNQLQKKRLDIQRDITVVRSTLITMSSIERGQALTQGRKRT